MISIPIPSLIVVFLFSAAFLFFFRFRLPDEEIVDLVRKPPDDLRTIDEPADHTQREANTHFNIYIMLEVVYY